MDGDLEQLREDNRQLQIQLKKMNRQVEALQRLIDRDKQMNATRTQLSAVITAEKSKQEKYMNLLLQNSPDIIMLLDQNGRFLFCTDVFLRQAGIRNFGLINSRTFQEVFARFADEEWIRLFAAEFRMAMQERSTVEMDTVLDIGRDGNPRNFTITIAPMIDEENRAEGATVLFHDLTEIVRARDAAETANRAKSDFLATVSHEIRTPMNAIIGLSDMLKKTRLDDVQRGYLTSVESASQVLLTLIGDILDFSKIEAGKMDLAEDYFDLRDLLDQTRAMFEIMFQQKELTFVCDFAPDLPRVVRGDTKRIGQVLTNLLNNALKYTEAGTVQFRAYVCAEGMVCFDVADTGIGISEANIGRLFTAFEQLDRVKNKQVTGTGLGLAITKRLCTMMGGDISVVSELGKGSTFTVKLDLPVGTEGDLPQVAEAEYHFTAPNAKVLVVDDIEINLLVAASMLEAYGVEPDQACSGQQALDMVGQTPYDLIFMDHMMPDMDGIETTLAIRAMGGQAGTVPIVALTANAVNDAVEMFFANGFNAFLPKPIDNAQLAECLLKWLPRQLIVEEDIA